MIFKNLLYKLKVDATTLLYKYSNIAANEFSKTRHSVKKPLEVGRAIIILVSLIVI